MNGRIQELVEEAGFYMTEKNGQALVQFAKYIIEECVVIAELKEQGYKDFDPNTSVGWYIKKHFGVEK